MQVLCTICGSLKSMICIGILYAQFSGSLLGSIGKKHIVSSLSPQILISKKSMTHVGTIALLSLLFLPLGNVIFFFLPWPFTRRMHLTLFVGWTVTTLLTRFLKKTSRKLPPDSFWTSCVRKPLLGLSPVVPHGSWVQSVVIVLRTLFHIWRESRVLPVLGCLLASFASSVTGCALHGDFTLQRTITLAVLDARMSLTPSLIITCVPDCTTSFFPSGETCFNIATKKLLVTRFDLPGVPV